MKVSAKLTQKSKTGKLSQSHMSYLNIQVFEKKNVII